MSHINSDEMVLQGNWLQVDNGLQPDATCVRIDRLVQTHLKKLGTNESGWDTLFRDPADGRLWELTYPSGEMQGGGPPRLECITRDVARRKYGTLIENA